jgi:hypothetical protein
MAAHGLGRREESDAALRELIEAAGAASADQIAELLAFRGDAAGAFDWLARNREYCATAPGFLPQCLELHLVRSPFLASLRDDPRWSEIVAPISDPAGRTGTGR